MGVRVVCLLKVRAWKEERLEAISAEEKVRPSCICVSQSKACFACLFLPVFLACLSELTHHTHHTILEDSVAIGDGVRGQTASRQEAQKGKRARKKEGSLRGKPPQGMLAALSHTTHHTSAHTLHRLLARTARAREGWQPRQHLVS